MAEAAQQSSSKHDRGGSGTLSTPKPGSVVPPEPQVVGTAPSDIRLNTSDTVVPLPDGGFRIKTGEEHLLAQFDGLDLEVAPDIEGMRADKIPDACKWYQSRLCPPEHRRHYRWHRLGSKTQLDKNLWRVASVQNHKAGTIPGAPGLRLNSDTDINGQVTGALGALFYMPARIRKAQIDREMGVLGKNVQEAKDSKGALFGDGRKSEYEMGLDTRNAVKVPKYTGKPLDNTMPELPPVDYAHHKK